jgi:hypothetical protein
MAVLKRIVSGEEHDLASRHVVGRSPGSHLVLDNRLVSITHAELLWNGSAWELRDLGSRNGTFVGARRLDAGERVTIQRGARLAFGDAAEVFELIDDGPPCAVAICSDGRRQRGEDGLLILPDAERPVRTIFESGGGNWVVESSDGKRQLIAHGDRVRVEGLFWRIELPVISELTWQPEWQMALHRVTMQIAVSRDEEQVDISLLQDGRTVKLPARTHNYLLFVLARARLADRARSEVPEAEAGWMNLDDLLDMLRMNDNTLNVAICRARKDLAQAEVLHAAELIERQPTQRRLRLGVRNIEITSE